MHPRRKFIELVGLAFGACICLQADPAYAGSYLRRAAVLLKGGTVEAKAMRARFHDRELAKLTHRLALARARAARDMMVPQEVNLAHPHLLLVLEAYERASDGASRGEHETMLLALAKAREESHIFLALLKQSGWTLPEL